MLPAQICKHNKAQAGCQQGSAQQDSTWLPTVMVVTVITLRSKLYRDGKFASARALTRLWFHAE